MTPANNVFGRAESAARRTCAFSFCPDCHRDLFATLSLSGERPRVKQYLVRHAEDGYYIPV